MNGIPGYVWPDVSAAVVATAFGGPEVLSVIDRPTPEPGAGEVRVAVRAAGMNPVDWKLFSGAMGADESTLPRPVGAEAAGVVTAVGAGVASVAVGDEVAVYPASGTYAAEIVVAADSVTLKPDSVSWEAAAGLLLTGGTAVHALEKVHVTAGDTVLIHGAAGGVGLLAVQLAKSRGATVIATASEARHEQLRALGAHPIVYGEGLRERIEQAAPGGIDAALDLVGTDEAVDVTLQILPDVTRFVSIAAFGRADTGVQLIGGGPGADPGTEIRQGARGPLLAAVANGSLKVTIAATYPLARAAEATREVMAGHTNGKIILLP
ncbi:zinc-binding alcohol dehydrogenase family protein [uncultured Jatrophihabitans sp.]|uniref:quinone oxidoreductase family protein n=1 Tax=uncultured Jatrophihabitans sp. TaxID=1610747 RepID=UPI0035CC3FE5